MSDNVERMQEAGHPAASTTYLAVLCMCLGSVKHDVKRRMHEATKVKSHNTFHLNLLGLYITRI